MAAIEHLISQARRHCSPATASRFSVLFGSRFSSCPPYLHFHRSLSSSSPTLPEQNPETQSDQTSRRPQAAPIQPVSYAAKPQESSGSSPQQENAQSTSPQPLSWKPQLDTDSDKPISSETRSWTREDIRYVKDVPQITPVSYPSRIAPLPEDRVEAKEDPVEEKEESVEKGEGELEQEWKRIQADNRATRRISRIEEEKVPFPTLIKVEHKKNTKVVYDLKEAIQLMKAKAKQNFDETLEAHAKLTSELRRTDLKLMGTVSLPHGTGKTSRVAVFAEGAAADEARAAGATFVGGQDLIEAIKNGKVKVNFDVCIATPRLMPHLREISKFLRRLMPKPENGTLTDDILGALKGTKQKANFKKDKTAIVHAGLGKVSFSDENLRENVGAFVDALLRAKPAGLKKSSKFAGYVDSFYICSTMGPSFPVTIQSISLALDNYKRLHGGLSR